MLSIDIFFLARRSVTFAIDMVFSNGTSMVMVFYVLSGFFIAYSYHKNDWSLGEFYFNRALRIYIPYLASIGISIGAMYLAKEIYPAFANNSETKDFNGYMVGSYKEQSLIVLKRTLLFMRSNGWYYGSNFVVWSLLYEMFFYIIVPFIHKGSKTFLMLSGMIFFITTFDLKEDLFNSFNIVHRFFLKYAFYFAIGLYLYDWMENRPLNKKFKFSYILIFSAFCFGLTLLGGVRIEKLKFYYSYDQSYYDFQSFNNGSHEVTLSYDLFSNPSPKMKKSEEVPMEKNELMDETKK